MGNNYNGNRPNYSYQGQGRGQGQQNASQNDEAAYKAAPLPADFVDEAERVIKKINRGPVITTSKIRNILSLVSDIYNVENLRTADTLTAESQTGLTMLRIRMVYEAGRDEAVKTFLRESKLIGYLKDIGTDRNKLINYAHYMEALVAYHRFYIGGGER